MASKIEAFLERREIRDVYDLEFMVKKGVNIVVTPEKAQRILSALSALTRRDYE